MSMAVIRARVGLLLAAGLMALVAGCDGGNSPAEARKALAEMNLPCQDSAAPRGCLWQPFFVRAERLLIIFPFLL